MEKLAVKLSLYGLKLLLTGGRTDGYFAGTRESEVARDIFWTSSSGNKFDKWEDREAVYYKDH
ncbi:hypothetical protein SAMD00023353_1002820 [Rosellinia necatrix]|uniref:Uncharacterized protein n=1 Tax=Rosellinia necatrix TaxID=77044 RepID=A0A1S8A6F2_ROSNE|nr:hypothetical protein SAMD00023353_1002820 [Rosellinia necatrix]